MIYVDLFIGFLKVGCFAFGGAYAAIPLIREVVLSYGWISDEMLTYMIAVSESTPGPIMVNLATYVGSSKGGVFGAALATLAVILPAFLIMLALARMLKNTLDNKYVQAAMSGLKPCVIGIILAIGAYMIISNCIPNLTAGTLDMNALLITAMLAALYFGSRTVRKKKMSPITLIIIAAAVGLIAQLL